MLNASVSTLSKLNQALTVFERDESGVTSIEYALIGSLIAVVIVTSVANVGTTVRDLYEFVADEVAKAVQ